MLMLDKAISVEDLSVILGGKFIAIKNLDVDFEKGKIAGVIGPSGAGKTTLIRAIVGRQKIANGKITVFGMPAGSRKLRQEVSYMTQGLSVYPDLTVEQNLYYFASMFGVRRKDMQKMIDDILHAVDMTKKSKELVSNLSGGQKQRVSLATSLIGSPNLMILDEPTVGLDPVLRDQIWKLFRELTSKGVTIIISSHVMDEAERCDDLLLIRDGKLLAHGSPAEICQRTNTRTVEQGFLKLVRDRE